jgi:outer membrane murein-binding lipoprotein Lpp
MNKLIVLPAVSSIALLSACSSTTEKMSSGSSDYEEQLASRNSEINALKQKLSDSEQATSAANSRAASASAASGSAASSSSSSAGGSLLPPNAKPGECFARIQVPPVFSTSTETVQRADGYNKVKVIPAVYGTEKKTVLAKEAVDVISVIPAVYGWSSEKVLVSPPITQIQRVPAVYGSDSSKVLIKPAHSVWKKGSGPITKVDSATGEIMCLVEVPATYRTITRRVLKTPETTKSVVVKPAVYKTVKTRVVKEPARTVTKTTPAVYKTVRVKTLVKEATTSSVAVPPVYESIKKTVKVKDGYSKWASILCKTNVTGNIIRDIQSALNAKKYKAGPVDGVYGAQTTRAVRKYQADKGLSGNGQLTLEVVDSLGVRH